MTESLHDMMSELEIQSIQSDNTLSEVVGVYMKGKILHEVLDILHLPHSIIAWEYGLPKPHPNIKGIVKDNMPSIIESWIAEGMLKPKDLGPETLTKRLVRTLLASVSPLPNKLHELAALLDGGASDESLHKKLLEAIAELNKGFKPFDYLLLRALHTPPDEVVSTDKQKTKEACMPLKECYPPGALDGMRVDTTWKFEEFFQGLCIKPAADRYTSTLYRLWKVWFRGRLLLAVVIKTLQLDDLTTDPVGDLVSLNERVTAARDDAFMRGSVTSHGKCYDYDQFMMSPPSFRLVLPEGDRPVIDALVHPMLAETP